MADIDNEEDIGLESSQKRKPKPLPVAVSEEEFIKLIAKTRKAHHKLAFLLGFASGLRVSEIVKLQPRDINFAEKNILIREAKGGKDRIVPLPKGFKERYINLLPLKCGVRALERAFIRSSKRAGLLVIKPTLHMHCVSEDTEILTKEGWKKLFQLSENEKIYSYNLIKDKIEDDKIITINKFNYKGDMINIKNTYLDCLMSMNHMDLMNIAHIKVINKKMVSSCWDGWKLISMYNFMQMPNKRLIKKKVSGIYNGSESIGIHKASLLGWILTDGCIFKRQNRKEEITISQSYDTNKEKCKMIENLLIKVKVEYSKHIQKPNKSRFNPKGRIMVYRILSRNYDLNWILKYLAPHKTPRLSLLNLKNEELQSLYKTMMLGDGCRNREFCAQNKKLIEFMQILCILINKRCLLSKGLHNFTGKEKFRTWISSHSEVNILTSQVSKINYSGVIWCPETINHTWIAKRNSKVFITGNSLRHGFATQLVKKGVPIHHIRTLMGHANISTTNIYLEMNPKEALKFYEDLF